MYLYVCVYDSLPNSFIGFDVAKDSSTGKLLSHGLCDIVYLCDIELGFDTQGKSSLVLVNLSHKYDPS